MYLKRLAFSSCVALSFCAVTAFGQQLDLRLTQIVSGLDFPTYLTHAGDSSDLLFVTEQHGRIRIIQNGILREQPFLNITGRVLCCGERGLLSVAFPPDYANKRYFYVNYTSTPAGATVISRFRTNSDGLTADPNSEQILLTIPQPYANHNGGLNKFGPDGFLYIGMGDGGSSNDPHNNAQNLQSLLGKMLRIDVESSLDAYRIPPSNPFANGSGGRGEIWAYGLRNPWRFSFDRLTGDLFIADVGQDTLEEVDFQPASSKGGENYGWRVLEASRCNIPPADCRRQGTVLPIFEYGRSEGVSITGGYVYRGSRFPNAQGTYLVADY
ncbi:MAG TPA: PQQ-dependent sugar dehydrogenase, partial [Bryobacteraceae bacterium]|nr:PQQ-dependent sugar dehydrogenase [Bryobacteraceae bacterium]